MNEKKSHSMTDMSPEEFQKWGHELVDWVADFLSNPEQYPVLAQVKPGDIRSKLPLSPPEQGESMDDIFRDFRELILPGMTHWNHPAFFAYFSITGSAPGILGELLSAALGVNAMLWRTSPSATELEEVCLDWLRQMLGLPTGFFGVIYDTASVSSLCSMAAAIRSTNGWHLFPSPPCASGLNRKVWPRRIWTHSTRGFSTRSTPPGRCFFLTRVLGPDQE